MRRQREKPSHSQVDGPIADFAKALNQYHSACQYQDLMKGRGGAEQIASDVQRYKDNLKQACEELAKNNNAMKALSQKQLVVENADGVLMTTKISVPTNQNSEKFFEEVSNSKYRGAAQELYNEYYLSPTEHIDQEFEHDRFNFENPPSKDETPTVDYALADQVKELNQKFADHNAARSMTSQPSTAEFSGDPTGPTASSKPATSKDSRETIDPTNHSDPHPSPRAKALTTKAAANDDVYQPIAAKQENFDAEIEDDMSHLTRPNSKI